MQNKEADGDKLIQKAEALCKPSLISLRLKPDWLNAAPLYEQALNAYKAFQISLTSGYIWGN